MKYQSLNKPNTLGVLRFTDGTQVLFSYESPVAAFVPGRGYLVADIELSITTQRRVDEWVSGLEFETVTLEEIVQVFNRPHDPARDL
jgi:hypothetical protein